MFKITRKIVNDNIYKELAEKASGYEFFTIRSKDRENDMFISMIFQGL